MRRVPIEICENFTGVNRLYDQQSIKSSELYTAQNFWPNTRGIAETRLGWTKFSTGGVANATAVRELARYYVNSTTKYKIAAMNREASDILVYDLYDTNHYDLTEITGSTALSASKNWKFVQYQGALYMGNGTEVLQKSTTGTTRADIAVTTGNYTPKGFPAGPYRARLLSYGDTTSTQTKKSVYYTLNLTDDFVLSQSPYVYVEHPEDVSAVAVFGRDEDRGAFGDLAIFTPTSTWIQRGDFGATSEFDRASERIGTLSPLSLVDTPWGLVGLGYDATDELVVFMIPIGAYRPLIISDPIRTSESLPVAYRKLANAVYYKGFYRLSFVPSGQTTPNREWWCDLRYFNTSQHNYGLGWWGPMTGRTIYAQCVQADASDNNELIGATLVTTTGHIMTLDAASTHTDNSATITHILETKSMDGKDPVTYKAVQGYSIGASCYASDAIDVVMTLDEGPASTSQEMVFAPVKTGTVRCDEVATSNYMRMNLTDGSAFVDFGVSGTLTDYIGYYLVVTDCTGKTVEGWIKAAGTTETYGSEAFTDAPFDVTGAWTQGTYWTVSGGKANYTPLAASFGESISESLTLSSGQLYKISVACDALTQLFGASIYGFSRIFDSTSNVTVSKIISTTGTTSWYVSGMYSAAKLYGIIARNATITFTGITLKPVTAPGANGVTIVNTSGGSTQNWVAKTSGFIGSVTSNSSIYAYTYAIYPPYSENSDYIHPALYGHRASVKCTYDDGHLLKIKRVSLIAGKTKRISY